MNLEHKFTIDDLLEGCKKSHPKMQQLLYEMLAPRMFGICMRYAKDRYEAEDILQAGFVKVFQKISDFRGDGSFEGWIKRIMVNTAIELYRKNQRMLTIVTIDEVYNEAHPTLNINNLEAKDLLNLIQNLPLAYRVVFNMYAIEGYTHKEIAEQLNISESASKTQLSRARTLLKQQIKQMEGNHANYAG